MHSRRVLAMVSTLFLVVPGVIGAPAGAEQDEGSELGRWHFDLMEHDPDTGPMAWQITPEAQLTILCWEIFDVRIQWLRAAELSARRFSGVTYRLTDVVLRIDRGPARPERWLASGPAQYLLGEAAVDLVEELVRAKELAVSADFVDRTTRTTTFDATGLDDVVGQMTTLCPRLRGEEGPP